MSTGMIWQTSSTSSADTEKLGELMGRHLEGGEVIELRSDLGGGKTTFVRGLARGLGCQDTVASPTFTINKIYKGRDELQIAHFDFYRLDDPGVVADQLAEFINDPNTIVVVEWSDIVQKVLSKDHVSIEFKPVAQNFDERAVTIVYPEAQQALIKKVESGWQEVRP